jgi:protein-S-isoprenylcysteine O-methyltransferase Ste14
VSKAEWARAAALYLPVMAAFLTALVRGRRPRQFAACLLSTLWVAVSLLALQRLNQAAGWWAFSSAGESFRAMPLELYLGWIVLWGLLPQLAWPRLSLVWSALAMTALDLVGMPLCGAVVHLSPHWLAGESVAVLLALLPALCLARWTLDDTHLRLRASMQVALSGGLFLFWLPELVFALRPGRGWSPLLSMPGWQRQLALQSIALLAVPGVAAVIEFAQRGHGTPIPYDPPKRLVTSGIYRYIANPMQLSCAMAMLAWACLLRNPWIALAAVVSTIYSVGIAAWDEGQDLAQRFPAEWYTYRANVHNWLPRWRLYHAGPPARVYIARTCGPCAELRRWIEARAPIGLEIADAEGAACGILRRMRYESADGSEGDDGVRAMARVLEHLNLAWALAGAVLRLPGVWWCVQLVMDASGLGPRDLLSEPR